MNQRIWAEIWNAGETVMYGYVNLISLSVERKLDGIGTIRLTMPIQDPNAAYLTVGRVVKCYTNHPNGNTRRLVTTGLLQKSKLTVTPTGDAITWDANDRFEELRRRTTYLNLDYNNTSLATALTDLITLASGWSVSTSVIVGDTSLRLDAVSVLSALQTLAEVHGYHFRLTSTTRQVQFGAFGSDSGIRATNIRVHDPMGVDSHVYLFDRLELITDGGEITNTVIPLMGSQEAFLDIGIYGNQVGGTGQYVPAYPYAIQTLVSPGGDNAYYLSDATSVTAYGERQKYILADRLFPVDTSLASAAITASAMLYLWAQNWLTRHKDPQYGYRLSLAKFSNDLQVGDKIKVVYRGEVYQDGQKVRYADINDDLWILKMTEKYGVTGATMDVEVSTIDLFPVDPVDIIANALETSKRQLSAPDLTVKASLPTSTGASVSSGSPLTLSVPLAAGHVYTRGALLTIARTDAATGPDSISITITGTGSPFGPYLVGPGAGLTATVELGAFMRFSSTTTYVITATPASGSGTLTLTLDLAEIVASQV